MFLFCQKNPDTGTKMFGWYLTDSFLKNCNHKRQTKQKSWSWMLWIFQETKVGITTAKKGETRSQKAELVEITKQRRELEVQEVERAIACASLPTHKQPVRGYTRWLLIILASRCSFITVVHNISKKKNSQIKVIAEFLLSAWTPFFALLFPLISLFTCILRRIMFL